MAILFFKRITIFSIYLALFALVVFGLYYSFKPKENCFDGRKNQNEQDVDCGGICKKECNKIDAQDLIIGISDVVPAGIVGKYDFYVKVTNPNAIFGSKKFDYSVSFKDSGGNELAAKNGSSFILPGESKYVIESNIDLPMLPASFDFKISNSNWVEFNDYYEKPDIQIVNKSYNEISGGTGFSEARGLLKNKSTFDFEAIEIQVMLKNAGGKILALNSTQMKTVRSGEERDFRVFWPNNFPGTVGDMETQPEVNVFDSDTFLKSYYKTEKFQSY
jgi:hypothetical protein